MCPLFLKDKCISSLFQRSTLKRNLTYSCFFFPLFYEHWFSPRLPRATRLLETSWLEKITVCNRDCSWHCRLPRWIKHEEKWTEQTTKINIVKDLQTCVIHLIPGSTCHWISNRMRYFLKNIFWSKYFPVTTNCRSPHSRVFLVKPVLKIS